MVSVNDILERPGRQERYASAESFLFGVVDFKNFQKARELKDFPRPAGQAIESKSTLQVPRNLQALDQRSDTGAIDVFHVLEIHDDALDALILEQAEQHFANFGRVVECDVAGDVNDRGILKLTRGNAHKTRSPFAVPVFCQRTRPNAIPFRLRQGLRTAPKEGERKPQTAEKWGRKRAAAQGALR